MCLLLWRVYFSILKVPIFWRSRTTGLHGSKVKEHFNFLIIHCASPHFSLIHNWHTVSYAHQGCNLFDQKYSKL